MRDVDNRLDSIDDELNRANRVLDGMSLTGALANKLKPAVRANSTDNRSKTAPVHFDVPVIVEKKLFQNLMTFFVFVDIIKCLLKLPNDSLLPALLRLEEDHFSFVDPANRAKTLQHTGYAHEKWAYRHVSKCVVRARHLHLDVVMKQNGAEGKEIEEVCFHFILFLIIINVLNF